MIKTIKQTLFTGWHFMRWLRLAFGLFFAVQAIQLNNSLLWLGAGFFLATSLANIGCCGAAACNTPYKKPLDRKS